MLLLWWGCCLSNNTQRSKNVFQSLVALFSFPFLSLTLFLSVFPLFPFFPSLFPSFLPSLPSFILPFFCPFSLFSWCCVVVLVVWITSVLFIVVVLAISFLMSWCLLFCSFFFGGGGFFVCCCCCCVFLCCYVVKLAKAINTNPRQNNPQKRWKDFRAFWTWPIMFACAKVIVFLGESSLFCLFGPKPL